MREIGIRELKSQLSESIRAVESGETLRITNRGRTVAELVPPAGRSTETHFHRLVSQGKLIPAALPHGPAPKPLSPLPGRSASEAVIDDRESER